MNAVITIAYHGQGQAIFDMTLPYWVNHGLPVVVLTPWDDPIKSAFQTVYNGLSSVLGPKARHRIVNNLAWFVASPFDYAIFTEADTICMADQIDFQPGFHGIVHNNGDTRYLRPEYACAPWMLDKESAVKMLDVALNRPDVCERGSDDRFYSGLSFVAEVPMLDYDPIGYAENTITDAKLIPPGTEWIHGIKSKAVLQAVLDWLYGSV
jgi:hypothetical protein